MEMRGNLWFLLPMGLLALVLFLDIKFPLLFWNLSHGLAVQGGEHSEWYCTMQKVSRDVMEVGIPWPSSASGSIKGKTSARRKIKPAGILMSFQW